MANITGPAGRWQRADACRTLIQDETHRPDLDDDLRTLIARCLAVDPRNRPNLEELVPLLYDSVVNIHTARSYIGTAIEEVESDYNVWEILLDFFQLEPEGSEFEPSRSDPEDD